MTQYPQIELLSSTKGRIDSIVTCIYDVKEKNISLLKKLLEKLPHNVHCIILCGKRHYIKAKSLIDGHYQCTYEIVLAKNVISTIWVQDQLIIGKSNGETICLTNYKNKTFKNIKPKEIKVDLIRQNPYVFEGGDLLVGSNFVVIDPQFAFQTIITSYKAEYRKEPSKSSIYKIYYALKENNYSDYLNIEYIRFLHSLFKDKQIVFFGNTTFYEKLDEAKKELTILKRNRSDHHIFFHVDLVCSLIGVPDKSQREQVLVAEIYHHSNLYVKHDCHQNDSLDRMACELISLGFKVHRNPILIPENNNERILPFNNCLVEVDKKFKRVWLPTFTQDKNNVFFKKNKLIWKHLGFKVLKMPDFGTIAGDRLGALRCMIKIIKRKQNNNGKLNN